MVVLISTFHLHNYAHKNGFVLMAGVCDSIFNFIENNSSVESLNCTSEDWQEFPINRAWVALHPAAPLEKISNFVGFVLQKLFLLCLLKGSGLRKIRPLDATFLLDLLSEAVGTH